MQASPNALGTKARQLRAPLLALAALLFPVPTFADAGLPMIMIVWPAMIVLLVPIIAVEAMVARRKLTVPVEPAILISTAANGASTIVGLPLAWVARRFLPAESSPSARDWSKTANAITYGALRGGLLAVGAYLALFHLYDR